MLITMTLGMLFLLFLLISSSLADLAGYWPESDVPPPPIDEFSNLVDFSKVSDAPITVGDYSERCDNDAFCYWACSGCTRPDDVYSCPNVGDWSLTFDDGPSNFTSDLIDYLDSQGVKATFFVVGSRVIENPEVLRKAARSGHQIGVHTWSHPFLTTQSNEQVVAELQWTAKAIQAATGLVPKYMRPPYGDFDDRIRDICLQLNYTITVWDLDTNDWMVAGDVNYDVRWIAGNFSQWVKLNSATGHTSLQHDLFQKSAAQGQKVVSILKSANFKIKSVAQCLGDNNPYANKNNVPTIALITTTTVPSTTSTPASTTPTTPTTPTTSTTSTSAAPTLSSPPNSGLTAPSSISSTSNSISYNNLLIITSLIVLIVFHN